MINRDALDTILVRCVGSMMAPTLVLVGELDDWTPAAPCRDMVDGKSAIETPRQPGDRSTVELVIYPDAYHSFDAAGLPSGFRYLGHRIQYNDAATQDAINRVHSFFERTLGN
jgi:dienelactone hydrolase